jgi:hypothetical protein
MIDNMSKMIQTADLVVGKRYYFDITETISGVFKGRFNDVGDYNSFTDIIKDEAYDDCYRKGIDGEIEFTYMEGQGFSEYEIA